MTTDSILAEKLDQSLLLAVQFVCSREGIAIPWDGVGAVLDSRITGGAIVQHLAKLRLRLQDTDAPVPPALRRTGGAQRGIPPRTDQAKPGKSAPASRSVNKRKKIDDDSEGEMDDDPDGEYGKPPPKRINKLGKKAKKVKVEMEEDDDDDEMIVETSGLGDDDDDELAGPEHGNEHVKGLSAEEEEDDDQDVEGEPEDDGAPNDDDDEADNEDEDGSDDDKEVEAGNAGQQPSANAGDPKKSNIVVLKVDPEALRKIVTKKPFPSSGQGPVIPSGNAAAVNANFHNHNVHGASGSATQPFYVGGSPAYSNQQAPAMSPAIGGHPSPFVHPMKSPTVAQPTFGNQYSGGNSFGGTPYHAHGNMGSQPGMSTFGQPHDNYGGMNATPHNHVFGDSTTYMVGGGNMTGNMTGDMGYDNGFDAFYNMAGGDNMTGIMSGDMGFNNGFNAVNNDWNAGALTSGMQGGNAFTATSNDINDAVSYSFNNDCNGGASTSGLTGGNTFTTTTNNMNNAVPYSFNNMGSPGMMSYDHTQPFMNGMSAGGAGHYAGGASGHNRSNATCTGSDSGISHCVPAQTNSQPASAYGFGGPLPTSHAPSTDWNKPQAHHMGQDSSMYGNNALSQLADTAGMFSHMPTFSGPPSGSQGTAEPSATVFGGTSTAVDQIDNVNLSAANVFGGNDAGSFGSSQATESAPTDNDRRVEAEEMPSWMKPDTQLDLGAFDLAQETGFPTGIEEL